jgi:2-oxoglutarate dehydrogenase E1 component
MSRQDANAAFARTSFLYGGNADYLENLYARYETDPTSVDAQWQAFFQSLKDERADVMTNARGPSWQRPYQLARSELTSALDGDWRETERRRRRRPASTSPPPRSSRRRAIRSTR